MIKTKIILIIVRCRYCGSPFMGKEQHFCPRCKGAWA